MKGGVDLSLELWTQAGQGDIEGVATDAPHSIVQEWEPPGQGL